MDSLSQAYESNFDQSSLKLVKVLCSSRFPVILVEDSVFSQIFVLKLFPLYEGNTITRAFLHETSVLNLAPHPNLIRIHCAFPKFSLAGETPQDSSISAVLMEYADNGDLCRLLKTAPCNLSEEAVRTLFHQLVDGLEFLHSQGLAHLDIKPDNLMLGEDFTLKIGDFDQITMIEHAYTPSKGTPGYRAPEVRNQQCFNLPAADIFSAGVVLFAMKSRVPPFAEGKLSKCLDLYQELYRENSRFWEIHCKAQNDAQFFSESFKDLFIQMLHPYPEKRPTIMEIRNSEWFNGPILDQKSLKEELTRL